MPTRGKRYAEAAKTVGDGVPKSPKDALELVKSSSSAKFDETVDVAVKLGVDPRHGDQMVRGNTTLPHGTGKVRKVAVITQGDGAVERPPERQSGGDLVDTGRMDDSTSSCAPRMMGMVGNRQHLRAKMPSKSCRNRPGYRARGWKSRPRPVSSIVLRRPSHAPLGKDVHDRAVDREPGRSDGCAGQGSRRPRAPLSSEVVVSSTIAPVLRSTARGAETRK